MPLSVEQLFELFCANAESKIGIHEIAEQEHESKHKGQPWLQTAQQRTGQAASMTVVGTSIASECLVGGHATEIENEIPFEEVSEVSDSLGHSIELVGSSAMILSTLATTSNQMVSAYRLNSNQHIIAERFKNARKKFDACWCDLVEVIYDRNFGAFEMPQFLEDNSGHDFKSRHLMNLKNLLLEESEFKRAHVIDILDKINVPTEIEALVKFQTPINLFQAMIYLGKFNIEDADKQSFQTLEKLLHIGFTETNLIENPALHESLNSCLLTLLEMSYYARSHQDAKYQYRMTCAQITASLASLAVVATTTAFSAGVAAPALLPLAMKLSKIPLSFITAGIGLRKELVDSLPASTDSISGGMIGAISANLKQTDVLFGISLVNLKQFLKFVKCILDSLDDADIPESQKSNEKYEYLKQLLSDIHISVESDLEYIESLGTKKTALMKMKLAEAIHSRIQFYSTWINKFRVNSKNYLAISNPLLSSGKVNQRLVFANQEMILYRTLISDAIEKIDVYIRENQNNYEYKKKHKNTKNGSRDLSGLFNESVYSFGELSHELNHISQEALRKKISDKIFLMKLLNTGGECSGLPNISIIEFIALSSGLENSNKDLMFKHWLLEEYEKINQVIKTLMTDDGILNNIPQALSDHNKNKKNFIKNCQLLKSKCWAFYKKLNNYHSPHNKDKKILLITVQQALVEIARKLDHLENKIGLYSDVLFVGDNSKYVKDLDMLSKEFLKIEGLVLFPGCSKFGHIYDVNNLMFKDKLIKWCTNRANCCERYQNKLDKLRAKNNCLVQEQWQKYLKTINTQFIDHKHKIELMPIDRLLEEYIYLKGELEILSGNLSSIVGEIKTFIKLNNDTSEQPEKRKVIRITS